jgi:hypothetical protein
VPFIAGAKLVDSVKPAPVPPATPVLARATPARRRDDWRDPRPWPVGRHVALQDMRRRG